MNMYKLMNRYLGRLKNFSLWSWEWMFCCEHCGASYQEYPDGVNGCQECGTKMSLVGQKVYCHPFWDSVYTYDEYLHRAVGMKR